MFLDRIQGGEESAEEHVSRDLLNLLVDPEPQGGAGPDHLAGYKWALDQVADIVCTDVEGRITYVNSQFCRMNRCRREDVIGRNNRIFSSGEHSRALYRNLWQTIRAGQVWRGELCNRAMDGTTYWVDTTIAPRRAHDGTGAIVGFIALRTDITARKRAEEKLRHERRRHRDAQTLFQDIIESLPNGVVVHDRNGAQVFRNKRHQHLDRATREPDGSSGEATIWQLPGGQWVQTEERRSRSGRLVAVQTDISPLKTIERQLLHQAETDSLTGLKNRAAFIAQLERAMAGIADGRTGTLALIDLNGFKAVNDGIGHWAGDALLVRTAEAIRGVVRPDDLVGRLGGDEFAVFLDGVAEPDKVRRLGNRLARAISSPVRIDRRTVTPSTAIGLATFPRDAGTADGLARCADIALHQAKKERGNHCTLFDHALRRHKRRREVLGAKLRQALRDDQINVVFQPQFSLVGERLVGFEALVRWNPGRESVSPPDLIAIAEETSLIEALGTRILDKAFAGVARMRAAGMETGTVAINAVAAQLLDPRFPSMVRRMAARHGLAMGDVELEITENVVLDRSAQTIEGVLSRLHQMGAHVALDDFGTGYASLIHLKHLPIRRIKIDKSFTAGLPGAERDFTIARAIISMAHSLGFDVVAEGVETLEQKTALAALGCDAMQGFLIGTPMSADAIIRQRLSA
ncbi:MAG: EAL domain-containing protein [Sphingomonadales bacterium]|nr:EAL domain-containing protein [Sphingomonadales bacterium]